MKKYLLVLFSLLYLTACTEEENPVAVQEDFDILNLDSLLIHVVKNPSGKLKSKTMELQNNISHEEFFYNQAGDSILTIKTYESNDNYTYSVHHYDNRGHIIYSKNYFRENGLLKYLNSTQYLYTDFHQIASISRGNNDSNTKILEFFYDENQRKVKMTGRLPFAGEKIEMFYENPESNKVIKEYFYWDKNIEIPYYSYQINYDDMGRIFSKTTSETEHSEALKYFYDEMGRIIEEIYYDLHFGQQEIGKVNYTYYE